MRPTRVLMGFSWLLLIASIGFFVYALTRVKRTPPEPPLEVYGAVADSFKLTNQWGETVSLDGLKGKVWIAYFFFSTCPSICPIMNRNMTDVQLEFAKNSEVLIVGFTVDPQTDTPEVLRKYGAKWGVQRNKWYYLTGEKATIYRLARQSFKLGVVPAPADQKGGEHDIIHSEKFVLVDREGNIRGYYTGIDKNDVQRLMQDVYRILQEDTRISRTSTK